MSNNTTPSISDWLKVKKAPDGFNQPAKTNQGNTSANPASNPYGTITETNAYTDLANGGQSAAPPAPAPASAPTGQNAYSEYATPNNIYSGAFDKVKSMNQNSADAYKKSVYAGADASATRLSGQKRNIYQQYEENKKAAEQAQRQALKELPVNMSGLGLYGQGIGETAISNIRNSYAQQLTELMKQRDNNLYDIDNQVEALRQQAEADIYNYEAQLMAQNPQYYLQLLQAENDENWRNKEWNYNIDRNAKIDEAEFFGTVDGKPTFASNAYYEEKASNETQAAANFIVQFGYLPENLYPNSKLTEEEKNNLVNIYKQNLYKPSSGSSGKSPTPKISGADVISYYTDTKNGDLYSYHSYAYKGDVNPLYVAKDNLSNTTYLNGIYSDLESAGYTPSQINTAINNMRVTVAKQIAKAEDKNGDTKDYETIMNRYGWE